MRKIVAKTIVTLTAVILPSMAAIAASPNTWFVGVGGGASWLNLRNNTNVYNGADVGAPYNVDTLTIHPDNPFGIGQFDVGYRAESTNDYIAYYQFYLEYRHFFTSNIDGTVTQYTAPNFTNYNYSMEYNGDLFTINTKIDFKPFYHVMPYVAIGFGMMLNHLDDYNETPTAGVIPRTNPGYRGITNMNGAFMLGVGVDYIFSDNIWLTLGYDHLFQGSIKSGPGESTWSQTKLNVGRLKMDTIFFNITARFPDAFMK